MTKLSDIVSYCDEITNCKNLIDYKGAYNGLQIENSGYVKKIGASVDAGLESFEKAIDLNIDFLIVHHGPFWGPIVPLTGMNKKKIKTALDGELAVYGSHLPLDLHAEIGNNVLLAKKIGLTPTGQFGDFEGQLIGWFCNCSIKRDVLENRLKNLFPETISITHGTDTPKRIGILTGSGGDTLFELAASGIDTLITGECSQHHFNLSQELGINLYLCGHYATEVFAVQALAKKVSEKFELNWEFIDTGCPL